MADTKASKKTTGDMVERISQYVADGTAGASAGTELPAGKSIRDIVGTAYVDAAGADASLENVQEHLVAGLHAGGAASDLPAGKALYDIIGTGYVANGGNADVNTINAHLSLLAKGTGTSVPANKSVYDLLGVEYVDASGAPEVDNIRAHLFKTGGMGGAVISKAVTFDGGAGTGAVGTVALFTVTGTVIVRVFAVCGTLLGSAGAPTISVGTPNSSVSGMIPVTTALDIDANEIWFDSVPLAYCAALDDAGRNYVITGGDDIQANVLVADITSGVITFYCIWTPLSSDGNVVAAA